MSTEPYHLQDAEAARRGLCGAAGLLLGEASPPAGPLRRPQRPSQSSKSGCGRPLATDTFDPKPEAGSDYCGPLSKPIPQV